MSDRRTRRGLGIVAKLMLLSVGLFAIPWLAGRYFQEMEDFVLEGQRSALQLAAQAVATVLQGREDLFDTRGGLPIGPWETAHCSPLQLAGPVQLDGSGRDWSLLGENSCRYGRANELPGAPVPDANDLVFDLTLGQRGGYLYALFEVGDDVVVNRNPRYRNLDGSDHLRISVPQQGGGLRRYLVTAEGSGPVTAYPVGEGFRYATGDGLPEPSIRGHWQETPIGYSVELRLPLSMLPEKRVGFAVADVDHNAGPVINVVGTFPLDDGDAINLVLLDSHEIRDVMQAQALNLPGAKITVVDDLKRVRSEVGAAIGTVEVAERERLFAGALVAPAGASPPIPAFSGARVTAASAPIRADGRVIGAVLIEQSNLEILGLQRGALERALQAIIFACFGIAGMLWLFAGRLAWRIHRLRDHAGDAIDAEGRVRRTELLIERRAGDEIGDLSRTVSGLLTRLSRYTSFLEQIPRTLRHELSNPLNSLSTSLQNLVADQPDLEKSKYLQSAERGVARIGEIVESLTDAASLEQALRDDEPERIDLTLLVARTVETVAAACPERRFSLHCPKTQIYVMASGFRIEQLLDKLLDNAVAFSPEGGEIDVELVAADAEAHLSVFNQGPPIPDELRERVFDSMVSTRGAGDRPHLGIGLYVVRLILEHLGGRVEARNREGGVVLELALPLAGRV